jgi:hypothetical protein
MKKNSLIFSALLFTYFTVSDLPEFGIYHSITLALAITSIILFFIVGKRS